MRVWYLFLFLDACMYVCMLCTRVCMRVMLGMYVHVLTLCKIFCVCVCILCVCVYVM